MNGSEFLGRFTRSIRRVRRAKGGADDDPVTANRRLLASLVSGRSGRQGSGIAVT